jgi:hypothetical protein
MAVHLQEGLAFVTAFKMWRHDLEGAPGGVIIHTDHHSLARLQSQPNLCRTQAGWLSVLASITHIAYEKGSSRHHVPADALSRVRIFTPTIGPSSPSTLTHMMRTQPEPAPTPLDPSSAARILDKVSRRALRASYRACPRLEPIYKLLRKHRRDPTSVTLPPRVHRFFAITSKKLLVWIGNSSRTRAHSSTVVDASTPLRIVVGNDPALRTRILEAAHEHPLAGHGAAERTYAHVSRQWHWRNLARDVVQYCRDCTTCQRNKHSSRLMVRIWMSDEWCITLSGGYLACA